MTQFWYTATEQFNKNHDGWEKYVEWSKLFKVNEIVSLDISLCPALIKTPNQEDWKHLVDEYKNCCFFNDLDYLKERVKKVVSKNILALIYEPNIEVGEQKINKFDFIGYDLIEDLTGISALTNCGGFDNSFNSEDLNSFGLLSTFIRAYEVQKSLLKEYPEEPHADTEIWAIWKLN